MSVRNEPLLKFSFQQNAWNMCKLGDVCRFEQGVQIDIDLQEFSPKQDYIRFIRIENYTQLSSDFRYIPGPLSNNKLIDENELAVVRYGATAGFIGRGLSGVLANNLFKLIPDMGKLDLNFFYQLMRSPKTYSFFQSEMAGGAMPALSFTIAKALNIAFPNTLDEQQKIADFLTAVDRKISQLTEKQRLLKKYKIGVMQQLFSQEIRFKDDDGKAFPDWEEKVLSKLASKCTEKNKGRLVKDALTNSAKHGIVAQQDYFDKDIANADNTDSYYVVNVDDFIYNPRISEHAPVGPIGRNQVKKGIMSPLYSVFRFNDCVDLDFVEYFFKGTTWYRYMHSVANFGARHDRMNISGADFMALPCPYPCLKEQQKIALFLQSIDKKVDAVALQIEQTKLFKKGLLQQMFV